MEQPAWVWADGLEAKGKQKLQCLSSLHAIFVANTKTSFIIKPTEQVSLCMECMWTEEHLLASKDTVFVATWSCDVIRQVFFTAPGQER